MRESAMMNPSVSPSEKYCWSLSPLSFASGRTAMALPVGVAAAAAGVEAAGDTRSTTRSVSNSTTGQGYQPGGGPAASNWQTTKGNSHTIEHLIINLITNTISPDTWESSGGQGRIQYFPLGHALVVSQIQEVQEEVQALLNALRRLQDIQCRSRCASSRSASSSSNAWAWTST